MRAAVKSLLSSLPSRMDFRSEVMSLRLKAAGRNVSGPR
jgi:hypothetical protein